MSIIARGDELTLTHTHTAACIGHYEQWPSAIAYIDWSSFCRAAGKINDSECMIWNRCG